MREHSSRVVSRLVKTHFFLLDSFKVLVTINLFKTARAHWIVGLPSWILRVCQQYVMCVWGVVCVKPNLVYKTLSPSAGISNVFSNMFLLGL